MPGGPPQKGHGSGGGPKAGWLPAAPQKGHGSADGATLLKRAHRDNCECILTPAHMLKSLRLLMSTSPRCLRVGGVPCERVVGRGRRGVCVCARPAPPRLPPPPEMCVCVRPAPPRLPPPVTHICLVIWRPSAAPARLPSSLNTTDSPAPATQSEARTAPRVRLASRLVGWSGSTEDFHAALLLASPRCHAH